MGEYYNKNNCFFEFGTCITREHSTTALSYKDPKLYYIHKTSHISCVFKRQQGQRNPCNCHNRILRLQYTGINYYSTWSDQQANYSCPWRRIFKLNGKFNTSVDIEEIVYTGNRHMNTSTLETSGTGNCHFRSTRRYDISSWYGIDSDIIHLLKLTTAEYGPITSFSSFSSINADPYPNVILNVGGNPLAVLPKNFNYNSSENVCTSPAEFRTMCSYKNINQNDQRENTWTEWTKCSKMCNEGTRIREKCNKTGHLLQREEQYCNMEPCKIETKKTCDQWTRFCSFIDSKSDTGICINKTCYCVLGEEYVSNNCYPRYGNCIVKPNPLSALGYRDPSVTYGYPDKTLYSCTTNDNQNYEVHIIAIFRSKSYNNKYRISVIAKDKITKPIVIVLASSDAINWEIHSQVGLHKIIYGGRSKLFSSVNQTSGCSFDVDSKKIDEFGYGEDSQNQETLTLLKTVSSQYGPITSFTGYEYLDTDNDIPRIILNVGGDPLLVPAMDNKFGKTYHNCTSVKPSSNPVTTTTVPTARSGTMTIFPSGKYAIRNKGNFILNCYYLNNGPLTKKHKIILYFEKLLDVSKAFTIIQITYNNSLNLTAIGQVTSNDSGKYTCMEISTGISASVDLLVLNRDLDWSWSEWSTCSKSCGIGIRSRVRYNKNNQEAEIENQYCNLQYCPDVAKKCYSGYCDLDVDSLHCMSGGSMFDNCYPYYDNCIIRENPKVALGYQDVSKSEASNLYSCTTTGNSKNETHIIGIYGDSINKEYTIDIYLRGPVTKPIILVLTSHHNTHWTINTSVDISKILYYNDDGHPSTVQKLSTSRCGFSAESRKDLYFGFGYDVNGGNTIKTIKAISEEFGTITSFTGYLHLRRTPFSNSSHIILNVGGDPLSVQPQKFKEQGCRPFDIFDETTEVNGFGGIIGLAVLLLSVAVGILVAIGVCCICKQQCFNNNRPMGRYIPPSVPLEVEEQDNVTNTNQEYAISDVAYPSAPPPAYNLENFPPPTETFPDSPPSYETVMRDCQKETHIIAQNNYNKIIFEPVVDQCKRQLTCQLLPGKLPGNWKEFCE
ncbi:hypothetical protein KUTeg_013407 [Tegillarca granosa]|uniref:Uncharacterized protein n=1 Tax=Tegillarca granosa TaxID=220873 RepID=A0ABQ9EZ11_TEGGR|nr:hypothetical protein KUTeg_013407 [Tegillarca granosa]